MDRISCRLGAHALICGASWSNLSLLFLSSCHSARRNTATCGFLRLAIPWLFRISWGALPTMAASLSCATISPMMRKESQYSFSLYACSPLSSASFVTLFPFFYQYRNWHSTQRTGSPGAKSPNPLTSSSARAKATGAEDSLGGAKTTRPPLVGVALFRLANVQLKLIAMTLMNRLAGSG